MHQEHSQQILTAEKRRRKREADEVNGDKAANTQEREGRQAAELREGRQAPEPRHEKDHVIRARYRFRLDQKKNNLWSLQPSIMDRTNLVTTLTNKNYNDNI